LLHIIDLIDVNLGDSILVYAVQIKQCIISFVLPVSRLTPLTIKRWRIVAPVKSHRFPRSHLIVILEITDLYLESTVEGGMFEKVVIKLPHEMTSEELVPKSPFGVQTIISSEDKECEADCAFEVQCGMWRRIIMTCQTDLT
jgi:hypothetical protein